MTQATFRNQFLQLMTQQEADLVRLFATAAAQIEFSLNRLSTASDGTIPPDKQELARQQVLAILSALFFVMNPREGISAFTTNPVSGIYVPESPFATILWDTARRAGELVRAEHEAFIRAQYPADITRAWERASSNPNLRGYVPPQEVVFDSGRALEDSVLFAAADTQRRVRQYLNLLFAERRPVREIADALAAFLKPDTLIPRHNAAFGRTGIALALQIARSLPVLTQSVVGKQLARQNPMITQVRVVRSRPEACPICDPVAAASPYSLADAPRLGLHANCLCRYVYEFTDNTSAVIEQLRGSEADMLTVRGALSGGIVEDLLRSQAGVVR